MLRFQTYGSKLGQLKSHVESSYNIDDDVNPIPNARVGSRDSLVKGASGSGLTTIYSNQRRSSLRNAIVFKRESRSVNKMGMGEAVVAVKERLPTLP